LTLAKKENQMTKRKEAAQEASTTMPKEAGGSPQASRLNVSPETLKERFGSQKIPLASDFASLIDMADVGSRAAGQASNQDGNPGAGLRLDGGKLAATGNSHKAIVIDSSGIGVVANVSKGIVVDGTGVGINAGTGIELSGNQVRVRPNPLKGIVAETAGVGLAEDAWTHILAIAYNAQFVAVGALFSAFATYDFSTWLIHIISRSSTLPVYNHTHTPSVVGVTIPSSSCLGYPLNNGTFQVLTGIQWVASSTSIGNGTTLSVVVKFGENAMTRDTATFHPV
jgi:hypothetical protein